MSDILNGKVAIVTGAGRGIGRAVAEDLAAHGAKILVVDPGLSLDGNMENASLADEVVDGINKAGGEAKSNKLSVASFEAGAEIVQDAVDSFGRLDIVVTVAGILRDRMIFNMTEDEWHDVIDVHLTGTFSVVRHAAPIFRAQKSGRIITFTSGSGLFGNPGQSNYGAAKSGIAGFTKVVSKDLGKYGVTANSIAPSAETRMTASVPEEFKKSTSDLFKESRDPRDIAPFVTYLASDYSAPINGQIFHVSGGTINHLTLPRRKVTLFNPLSKGRFKQEDFDLEGRGLMFGFGDKNNEVVKALDGKVAIVTGSGRGIGRGIALELSKLGAKIVVNDVGASLDGSGNDKGPAQSVVEEISELGGKAVASTSSVATVAGGKEIVDKAIEEFGRLDIVITPAGILRDRMIFNMTKEEWQDVIDVHLTGTFSVVAPASKIFREQKSGRIITFSSVSGLIGYSGQSNYGAAKDAIAGFTRVVAKELAKYGVTTNAISPGANTRMTESIPDSTLAMRVGGFKKASENHFTSDPEDVAPVVAWLCTDSASHINGEVVHAGGNRISLFNKYEIHRSITKSGRWTVEELANAVPETFGPELINPAPPQE
jgi:multifunctional beta-oxidation protein|tara:strand:- start:9760 stop:11556 length:1797 start_codon:yes stop_codon:yes gene_type:complete